MTVRIRLVSCSRALLHIFPLVWRVRDRSTQRLLWNLNQIDSNIQIFTIHDSRFTVRFTNEHICISTSCMFIGSCLVSPTQNKKPDLGRFLGLQQRMFVLAFCFFFVLFLSFLWAVQLIFFICRCRGLLLLWFGLASFFPTPPPPSNRRVRTTSRQRPVRSLMSSPT